MGFLLTPEIGFHIEMALLAPAAPVTQLPPVQLVIDEVQIDGKGSRQVGNKRKERLSVRFPGPVKLQHLCERPHSLKFLKQWNQAV